MNVWLHFSLRFIHKLVNEPSFFDLLCKSCGKTSVPKLGDLHFTNKKNPFFPALKWFAKNSALVQWIFYQQNRKIFYPERAFLYKHFHNKLLDFPDTSAFKYTHSPELHINMMPKGGKSYWQEYLQTFGYSYPQLSHTYLAAAVHIIKFIRTLLVANTAERRR